jgi:hypothetical protein
MYTYRELHATWQILFLNSFTPRLEQTTSSAHNFSKSKVWMGKYLKKSYSYYQCEQCFFKYSPKYLVSFSRRRRCQNSKMATLGLNELTLSRLDIYSPTSALDWINLKLHNVEYWHQIFKCKLLTQMDFYLAFLMYLWKCIVWWVLWHPIFFRGSKRLSPPPPLILTMYKARYRIHITSKFVAMNGKGFPGDG